jgi:hypothetical protein
VTAANAIFAVMRLRHVALSLKLRLKFFKATNLHSELYENLSAKLINNNLVATKSADWCKLYSHLQHLFFYFEPLMVQHTCKCVIQVERIDKSSGSLIFLLLLALDLGSRFE